MNVEKRIQGSLVVGGLQVKSGTLAKDGVSADMIYLNAGIPSSGGSGTLNGVALPGALLVDTTNMALYQNTNTQASPTWTAIGGAAVSDTFVNLTITGLLKESITDTVTAHSGGGQTSATALTTELNRITTVAAPGDSVKLPASQAGLTIIVINHGANSCQVYGAGTDTVDDVATATGVAQMAGSVTIYSCTTAGAWYSNGIGTGYAGQYPTISYANGLATTGTTQAGATATGACINRFTTVGSAGGAAVLPISAPGMQITVNNAAATNSMNLFPNAGGTTTETINALSANAALAIAAGKTAFLTCAVAGQWHCQAPS